jgi:hypothetical protein
MDAGLAAVQSGLAKVDGRDDEASQKEEAEVRAFWKSFDQAREFDKDSRKQMTVDRRYAAGNSDPTWAVTTNLIGSFIDILSATLYARDPDVSIRKAPQVDEEGSEELEDMARTGELIVARLWKDAKLKKRMRKVVRSVLSVSVGWLKAQMTSEKIPMPLLEAELNDAQQNLRDIASLERQLLPENLANLSEDELAEKELQLRETVDSITQKLEVAVRRMLAVDFIPAEDIQVSLDVACVEDYLDADWVAQIQYIAKDDLMSQFPALTETDLKTMKCYYRKNTEVTSAVGAVGAAVGMNQTIEVEAYSSVLPPEGAPAFGKVVEKWNRRTGHIETAVEGIKRWAVVPYAPPYQSSRFYPFFYFSFYEVDGLRYPQSLSSREAKLQDEYSCTRSNFRQVRERSFPGVIVNAGALSDEELKKLKDSKNAEIIPLKPTDPNVNLQTMFAEKPISRIDPRLYDTQPIISDMERMSGVQEAQSAAVTVEKTATEAEIQQGGFSARTQANRDMMESTLTELGQYTLETSMQCLPTDQVQRMVGTGALWPEGMGVEEVLQMWVVEVEAGTTGKPKNRGDREAWATVMPLIAEQQVQIAQLQTNPMGQPLAQAKIELITETMRRMGDETDVSRFIPKPPAPLAIDPITGQPVPPPGAPTSAPPGDPGAPQPPSPATDAGGPPAGQI